MKSWALYGITKRLTEKFTKNRENTKKISPIFSKSLHIYPIDVGNSGDLNFEISAIATPQYNIHRFGIFFTDSPRHADILLILGKPTKKMIAPLMEAINQLPEPFGIVVLENAQDLGIDINTLNIPNIVAHIKDEVDAKRIISILLDVMGR
jgi:Ni,Fe-hydrogenase III small subunit